ncbi:MAG: hypothetical protein JWN25_429, partial [Verrucomicrobiales bacterium]|nr:hypothetical protein [Verrucomicrobiales bacterium]
MRIGHGKLPTRSTTLSPRLLSPKSVLALAATLILSSPAFGAPQIPAASHFEKQVKPILAKYCADCHADGAKKGGVDFDELKADHSLLEIPGLWYAVLKNTRAGVMPPEKKEKPTAEEQKILEQWIKYDAFGIDKKNPDPGRVTVRRLNRVEYSNTIRDLMGVEFSAETEFPPDDTGYGFDNIGDVLSLSPMLLEKYLDAAKSIFTEAVPVVAKVMPEKIISGKSFHKISETTNTTATANNRQGANSNRRDTFLGLNYYETTEATNTFKIDTAGAYKLVLNLTTKGAFDYDPGRCRVTFKLDGKEMFQKEYGWYDTKNFQFTFDQNWEAGEHQMYIKVEGLTSPDQRINALEMRIADTKIQGPMDQKYWTRPKNYERFFPSDAPASVEGKRKYATQILRTFMTKAFRRPVDEKNVDRFVSLAESIYTQPGKNFESGIAHSMIAVLASPRFLFRLEDVEAGSSPNATVANVDEYSLASRLSYFLWSTMPDDELFRLAQRGELRKLMTGQVKRMLDDP